MARKREGKTDGKSRAINMAKDEISKRKAEENACELFVLTRNKNMRPKKEVKLYY